MKQLLLTSFLCLLLLSFCESPKEEVDFSEASYTIFFGDKDAGYQTSTRDESGTYRYTYEFNDRGRGPRYEEAFTLNENGVIDQLTIIGYNYLKDSVNEQFSSGDGVASWDSNSEQGSFSFDGEAFYSSNYGSFANMEHLVRKLLIEEDQTIDLLPSGTAKLSNTYNFPGNDTLNIELRLIELTGLSFTPNYLWMDTDDRFFAFTSSWFVCIRDEYTNLTEDLKAYQQNIEDNYLKNLTEELSEIPKKPVLIQNVSVVDVENGELIPNQSVLIKNNRIDQIVKATTLTGDYTIIDGTDKTLLPGLFDMHTHISKTDGLLHLAAGITSVRDLANSLDLKETADAFNNNGLIGPRIQVMAGFIDQAGPYAGPTGKIVNNLQEGLEAVSFYKENGYEQIKLYSSIDPSWVKPMAERAHELGMRVSGHIPAYMIAEDAVKSGYDEIQHVNMVALNFLSDTIDTRTPLRFSMIGKHTHQLDLTSQAFTSFVSLLKQNNTVVDPTVSIFEGMLASKAGEPDPSFSMILNRLPVTVARGFYSGGLPIPVEEEENYKKSYEKLLAIVKALHESGVTIVPGTDAMAGFGLHRELENYARAGISNADVLKIATITSAAVAGVDDVLGTISEGKLADVILVDGNPLENIGDIRRVELTIKDGIIYQPEKLYSTAGVKHYQ
jgi:hypothetical protein